MNQNNQKEETKEFENEMDFYVPVGAIIIEFEDNTVEIESKNPNYTIVQFGSALESEN
jgi:hypothetical protein